MEGLDNAALSVWFLGDKPSAARILDDSLVRHSPRILEGAQMLCEALDGVRARRRR